MKEIFIDFKVDPEYADGSESKAEFTRLLEERTGELNSFSVQRFLSDRALFGVTENSDEDDYDHQQAIKKARDDKINELSRKGASTSDAETEADRWLAAQFAMYSRVHAAGTGDANVSETVVDRVRSSINTQWRSGLAIDLHSQIDEFLSADLKETGVNDEQIAEILSANYIDCTADALDYILYTNINIKLGAQGSDTAGDRAAVPTQQNAGQPGTNSGSNDLAHEDTAHKDAERKDTTHKDSERTVTERKTSSMRAYDIEGIEPKEKRTKWGFTIFVIIVLIGVIVLMYMWFSGSFLDPAEPSDLKEPVSQRSSDTTSADNRQNGSDTPKPGNTEPESNEPATAETGNEGDEPVDMAAETPAPDTSGAEELISADEAVSIIHTWFDDAEFPFTAKHSLDYTDTVYNGRKYISYDFSVSEPNSTTDFIDIKIHVDAITGDLLVTDASRVAHMIDIEAWYESYIAAIV